MADKRIVALAVLVMANRGTLNADSRQPYGVKMCEEFCASLMSCVRPAYVERYLLCDLTCETSKQVSVNTSGGNLPHPHKIQGYCKLGAESLDLSQRVLISRRHLRVLVTLGLKKQTHPTGPETKGTGKVKDKEEPEKFISMTTSTIHYNMMHLLMRKEGTHFYFTKVLNLTSCKLLERQHTLPDKNLRSCVHVLYVGSHIYISTLMEDWSLPALRFEISMEVFRLPGPPVSCFSFKDDSVYCLTHNWIYKLKIFEALALAEKTSIQLKVPRGTQDVIIDSDNWSHVFMTTNSSVVMKPFDMSTGSGDNVMEIQLKCQLVAWYKSLICFHDSRLPCPVEICPFPVIISGKCRETNKV